MGCGNSTTAVQTFKNPEENKHYHHQQQQHIRKSSAASVRSSRKSHSRKSSTSSSSSSGSKLKKRTEAESRVDSCSTKKTYTIQRENSGRLNDFEQTENLRADENENTEHKTDTTALSNTQEEEQFKHDTLQSETFLTGNYRRQENNGDDVIKDSDLTNVNETREEKHERLAKQKEEKRLQTDYEQQEEEELAKLCLVQLNIPPPMEPESTEQGYTTDDIVNHNEGEGFDDWFKYGKKVYSWSKMLPIIKERMNQYHTKMYDSPAVEHGYPVYLARSQGVSRKELKHVLASCYIGNVVELSQESILAKMKNDVNETLEELQDVDGLNDFKNQLSRWFRNYPNIAVYNTLPDADKDPNSLAFRLPDDILSDLSVLRSWVESFEWDTELPEGGYFGKEEYVFTDFGNEHEVFSELVASRVDISIPELDMEIEGEAAWKIIDLDIFKNDVTTDAQEEIWKARETRTNLEDETWREKRIYTLYQKMVHRHEWPHSKVEPYMVFFDKMKQDWEKFQKLCEEEFVPPKRDGNEIKTMASLDQPPSEGEQPSPDDKTADLDQQSNERTGSRDESRPKSEENVINNTLQENGSLNECSSRLSSKQSNRSDQIRAEDNNVNSANGEMPALEKMDSGLELETPEQYGENSDTNPRELESANAEATNGLNSRASGERSIDKDRYSFTDEGSTAQLEKGPSVDNRYSGSED